MRTVTISLDEDLARKARMAAAERDMSLSRFVAELLRTAMDSDSDYEAARKAFFARPLRPLRGPGERLPTRDELYDRPRAWADGKTT